MRQTYLLFQLLLVGIFNLLIPLVFDDVGLVVTFYVVDISSCNNAR